MFIKYILNILLLIGFGFTTWLVCLLASSFSYLLLAPIGIILASFIASASVMRSIKSNENLKKNEIIKLENSQLLFIKYVCEQIKSKNTLQWGSKQAVTLGINKVKIEVNEIASLWEKIIEEKYFIFLLDDGYNDFLEISRSINKIKVHVNNFMNTEEQEDKFIFEILKDTNVNINIHINKLLATLNSYKVKI